MILGGQPQCLSLLMRHPILFLGGIGMSIRNQKLMGIIPFVAISVAMVSCSQSSRFSRGLTNQTEENNSRSESFVPPPSGAEVGVVDTLVTTSINPSPAPANTTNTTLPSPSPEPSASPGPSPTPSPTPPPVPTPTPTPSPSPPPVCNQAFQNKARPMDTDGDGFVSPRDVLMVNRFVHFFGEGWIPDTYSEALIDVDGDCIGELSDAKIITDYINGGGR